MTEQQAETLRATCPSRAILEQVADKWSVLILAVLCDGPLRFNAIKRRLEGITQKSLTQTLRRLERSGIVARRVIPVSPVAVEYRVTPLGQTLKAPFQALYEWSVAYMPEITRAQHEFDLREQDKADGIAAVPVMSASPNAGASFFPLPGGHSRIAG
ncbi:MAG: winged helix-turn-helix transcriptional regulator [Janthinobacterium lividum]